MRETTTGKDIGYFHLNPLNAVGLDEIACFHCLKVNSFPITVSFWDRLNFSLNFLLDAETKTQSALSHFTTQCVRIAGKFAEIVR